MTPVVLAEGSNKKQLYESHRHDSSEDGFELLIPYDVFMLGRVLFTGLLENN